MDWGGGIRSTPDGGRRDKKYNIMHNQHTGVGKDEDQIKRCFIRITLKEDPPRCRDPNANLSMPPYAMLERDRGIMPPQAAPRIASWSSTSVVKV